jgi:uncharacterized lipoprotein YbaY
MRTASLAVALAAGALLAACSKPEPAAGAPSPEVVAADTTNADSTTMTTDSTKAAAPDSAAMDSTMGATGDSATTTPPDSAR